MLCSGDGELAIFEALKDDAPKVIDGDDPKGGLFLTDRMFTEGPLPARHLVDLKSYRYSIEGHRATSLIAQLGCPFGCGFCGGRNSKSLRQIRNRDTASILQEVEHLHVEHGYTGFMFYDDELNVSKSFVELMNGLSDLQARLGADFRLRGFVKSELFTKEQAEAMFRAGFRWLLCGFEAANERILVNIDKRAKLADNDRCVELAKTRRPQGQGADVMRPSGRVGRDHHRHPRLADPQRGGRFRLHRDHHLSGHAVLRSGGAASRACPTCGPTRIPRPATGCTPARSTTRCARTTTKAIRTAAIARSCSPIISAPNELVTLRDMVERDVRKALNIPFNPGAPALRYEHSMGQGLPDFIHRIGMKQASATLPDAAVDAVRAAAG